MRISNSPHNNQGKMKKKPGDSYPVPINQFMHHKMVPDKPKLKRDATQIIDLDDLFSSVPKSKKKNLQTHTSAFKEFKTSQLHVQQRFMNDDVHQNQPSQRQNISRKQWIQMDVQRLQHQQSAQIQVHSRSLKPAPLPLFSDDVPIIRVTSTKKQKAPTVQKQNTTNKHYYRELKQTSNQIKPARQKVAMVKSFSRLIFPPIPIGHLSGKNKFYQCSVCSHTKKRLRDDWQHDCNILQQHCIYKHTYTAFVKYKLNNSVYAALDYLQLIDQLTKKDGTPLTQQEKDKLKAQYPTWLAQYQDLRNNPKQAQARKKAQQAILRNNIVAGKLQVSTNALTDNLENYQGAKTKLKQTGFQQQDLEQKRQKFADNIWERFLPSLQMYIKGQVKRSIGTKSKFDSFLASTILSQLTLQIKKIVLNDSVSDWHSQIQKFLEAKIKAVKVRFNDYLQILMKTKKQIRRQRSAAIFLKSIPFAILMSARLLIQRIKMARSRQLKITSVSMHNQVIKSTGFNLPLISSSIIQKPLKTDKIFTTMNKIKQQIYRIINSDMDPILAVDLWFVFTLGLRLNDIQRVQVQKKDGIFYDYIGLSQLKNKHNSLKFVPTSLRKLILWFKVFYPITDKRVKNLSNLCKSNLGGFYLLRHSCITSTLTRLMQATNFAPHKCSSTTLKYYVDYNNFQFMDKMFHLNITNEIDNQKIKSSGWKCIFGPLGQRSQSKCDPNINVESQLILPSKLNQAKQNAHDLFMQRSLFQPQIKQHAQIIPEIATSRQMIIPMLLDQKSQNYFFSIFRLTYCNFFKLLADLTSLKILIILPNVCISFDPSDQQVKKQYQQPCQALLQNQTLISENLQENNLKNVNKTTSQQQQQSQQSQRQMQSQRIGKTNQSNWQQQQSEHQAHFQQEIYLQPFERSNSYRQIVYKRDLTPQQLELQLCTVGKMVSPKQSAPIVLIAEQNSSKREIFNLIKKPVQKIKIKTQNPRKSQRISMIQKMNLNVTVVKDAFCRQCKQPFETKMTLSDKLLRSYCQCQTKQKKISMKQLIVQYENWKKTFSAKPCILNTKYVTYDTNLIQPPYMSKDNNISVKIKESGRTWITQMGCSQTFTKQLLLPWEYVSTEMGVKIKKCIQYQSRLPVEIKKCKNISKGLGVFTTQNLQPNTIISTYLGIVRPSVQIIQNDDSLISIGWLQKIQLFIACNQASNLGRYLNSSETPNCKLKLAFIKDNMFCPFIITNKNINKGEELTWKYGKSYWEI